MKEFSRRDGIDEGRPEKAAMPRRHLLNAGTALGAAVLLSRTAEAQHQHHAPAPAARSAPQTQPRPAARPQHDHSAMGLDPGPIVEPA